LAPAAAAIIGDFEITLIRDSSYWWDGGAYFGVVPKTLWSRKLPARRSESRSAGIQLLPDPDW
jgi:hypothetical protein